MSKTYAMRGRFLLGLVGFIPFLLAPQTQLEQTRDVSRHVRFLASDELKGRRAGTHEADVAARYIAAEFLRLGLEPLRETGEGSGGYDQVFEISMPPVAGEGTRLEWNEMGKVRALATPELKALPFSASGTVQGNTLAISPEDLLAGKVDRETDGLIFVAKVEKPTDPHGNPLRAMAKAAQSLVAAGLLFWGPMPDGGEASLAREGSAPVDIPVAWVAPEAFAAIPAHLSLAIDLQREKKATRNVLALLPGKKDASEFVVIGAHYDHLGLGGEHSLAPGEHAIHRGADDNASGTAALLEIARALAPEKGKLDRHLLFAAFGAEELGLLGSAHFVKDPPVALDRITAMLNLDMVGRLRDGKLDVGGVGTSAKLQEIVEKANEGPSLNIKYSQGALGFGGSDHLSFYQKEIPVLFFFTGLHADYHKPSDTQEKINYEGILRIAELVTETARAIAANSDPLPFTKPKEPERTVASGGGMRAWLGTVPEYGDYNDGVHLSGTSAGSPAEKAGLKAGDILTRLGEIEIKNIYDLTAALGKYKAGETIEIEFLREGKKQKLSLTLGSR